MNRIVSFAYFGKYKGVIQICWAGHLPPFYQFKVFPKINTYL